VKLLWVAALVAISISTFTLAEWVKSKKPVTSDVTLCLDPEGECIHITNRELEFLSKWVWTRVKCI